MPTNTSPVRLIAAGVLVVGILGPGAPAARAQTDDNPPPREGYSPFIPDFSHGVEKETTLENHIFTLHLGLAPIFDYEWFSQDQASIEQVGVQDNAPDIRSARIQLRGNLFARRQRPWKYLVSFEYRGFDSDPDQDWNFTDWVLTIPTGPLGDLSVGKVKESFVYEMVGDAANLPHAERLLSPFFTSRSVGFRLNRTVLDQRATLAVGAFNDWFTQDMSYDESGWDFASRVTALPLWSTSERRFLHLAGAWRYVGADRGLLRYRGRPQSNVSDYFVDATVDVDTGGIPASHANHWSAEALWNEGPVSVLAEYVKAEVSSVRADDPQFRGYYATASWFLTGEHRPYDRKVGYARRPLPEGRWGAVELVARYGLVDLVDKGIDGGYMTQWFTTVNWWATRRWRFTVGYGLSTLEKEGIRGKMSQVLARVQWIY